MANIKVLDVMLCFFCSFVLPCVTDVPPWQHINHRADTPRAEEALLPFVMSCGIQIPSLRLTPVW